MCSVRVLFFGCGRCLAGAFSTCPGNGQVHDSYSISELTEDGQLQALCASSSVLGKAASLDLPRDDCARGLLKA